MEGFFIALVVVGPKEEDEVRLCMEAGLFTSYVQELYEKSVCSAMGRWLMLEVKDKAVMNDIRYLISIRMKPKKQQNTIELSEVEVRKN